MRRSVPKGATTMNTTKRGVALAIGTCGLLAAAGCAGATVTKTVAPTSAAAAPSSPAEAAAAPPPPSSSPSPSSSALTGPLGTTYTDTGQNDAGNDFTLNVTATKVDQRAQFSDSYGSLTNSGDHLVAVEFQLAETAGNDSDDVNGDASVIGTDGQQYTTEYDTVADGTNFDSGQFNLSAGQSVTGWVSFELPPGVSIASVQWTAGLGGQAATWTVQ
jgi:hypothetical protein